MGILQDISLLWSFLHVLFIYMLLYTPKYEHRKATFISLIAMIPLCIVNSLLFMYFGNEIMAKMMVLTLSIPSLIFFFFLAKYKDGRFFFTFCVADTISFEIIIITSIISTLLHDDNYIILFVLRLLIYPIFEWFLWKFVRNKYLEIQENVNKGWGVCAVVSILFYALLAYMISSPRLINSRPDDIPSLIIVFIIMPLTYFAILRMLNSQKKIFETEKIQIDNQKLSDMLENELEIEKEYVRQAKQNRHDIRHGVNVVFEYLDKEDIEGAKNYLSEYSDSLGYTSLVKYCDNIIVNGLFRILERKSSESNIKCKINAVVPAKLPYSKIEATTLFGNLLENAYEAALKCEDPFINVESRVEDDKLIFEIQNSVLNVVEFVDGNPVSTKTHGGIGVISVKQTLNKHNGMMRMTQNQNVFITQIIQNL